MINDKQTILITGCSSGIGYDIAQTLHARGYNVFATARKKEDVKRLQAEGLQSLRLDLDDDVSITQAVQNILEQSDGHIHGLINNGAFGQPGAVEDLGRETLRAQFETNLFGTHELTRQVIPIMREQGYGRIIQISSVLGFAALRFRGAYISSKYALEGLTDTLRLELRDVPIEVSLIEPGPITSKFRDNSLVKFKENINVESSAFCDTYKTEVAKRLEIPEGEEKTPFNLEPEAVTRRVIHALEARRPKARYYVTFPTFLFGYLKRILSTPALDFVLSRAE